MKVSGKKAAEHRAALVATARRLLQERGFDGAGVAEISREAGLTQGALYGQFKSKGALAREAACEALADGAASWRELREAVPDPLSAYLHAYLCESHVKDAGSGCLMAACVSDMPRQDDIDPCGFCRGFPGRGRADRGRPSRRDLEGSGTPARAHSGRGDGRKRCDRARFRENRSEPLPRDHRSREGRAGTACAPVIMPTERLTGDASLPTCKWPKSASCPLPCVPVKVASLSRPVSSSSLMTSCCHPFALRLMTSRSASGRLMMG